MQPLPHNYVVTARAGQQGSIVLNHGDAPQLETDAPPNFGGPEGYWSPEDLFVAAVADCFILTFRAISRLSKLDWIALDCSADGTLDRVERQMQFTGIAINATLKVAGDVDLDKAESLLHKADQTCLVTNSLKCPTTLKVKIETVAG